MRNTLQKVVLITIVITCAAIQTAMSQFTMDADGSHYYGTLDFGLGNPPQAIGIGDFDSPTKPSAALHINTNLVTSPFYGAGEVFRTDAPSGLTAWRMFSGNVAANEKFSIVNPNGSKNIELSAVQNGSLSLLTDSKNRLCITGAGLVGIGTTEPVYTLQVAGSFSARQIFIEDKNLLALISEMQTEISELKKVLAAR